MKKKFYAVSSFVALAVLLGVISWGPSAQAQNSPGTQSPPQTQNPPDQQAPPDQPSGKQAPDRQSGDQGQPNSQANDPSATQTFVGTVTKQGDKYMFQDDASGKTYDIDRQDEVKRFEGKKVRVHGTLDTEKNMIHVQ